jgi:hypothetical protein
LGNQVGAVKHFNVHDSAIVATHLASRSFNLGRDC